MTTDPIRDERTPLISPDQADGHHDAALPYAHATKSVPSRLQRSKAYLMCDVDTRWTDSILIFCYFLSGMIDAGAYNAYECFVSMMTGNTIFLALGVSDLPVSEPPLSWTKSLCSILAFMLGTLVFSAFHHRCGARRRWTLILLFFIQGVLVLVSAALTHHRHVSESPAKRPTLAAVPADPGFPWMNLVPIALLSIQASGKVLASRLLNHPYLPTVILTVLYSDLLSDPALFTAGIFGNGLRTRRVGGAVFYFGGAVVGGVLASSTWGFEGALWIAGIGNMAIAACWAVWRSDGGGA